MKTRKMSNNNMSLSKKCKILPSHGGKLRISRRVKYVDFDTSPRLANFEILTVQILDGGGIIGIELSC